MLEALKASGNGDCRVDVHRVELHRDRPQDPVDVGRVGHSQWDEQAFSGEPDAAHDQDMFAGPDAADREIADVIREHPSTGRSRHDHDIGDWSSGAVADHAPDLPVRRQLFRLLGGKCCGLGHGSDEDQQDSGIHSVNMPPPAVSGKAIRIAIAPTVSARDHGRYLARMAEMLTRLQGDLATSRKAGDKPGTLLLGTIISDIKNREIEIKRDLTDSDVTEVLRKGIKKRRESIEMFEKGNRPELAAIETAQLKQLEAYLPAGPNTDEIRSAVQAAIAGGAANVGSVMGVVMPQFKGRADGGTITAVVKEELSKKG